MLTKVSLDTTDPFTALVIELAVGILVLWTLIWRRKEDLPSRRRALWIAWPGLLQPGLNFLPAFLALNLTTASMVTLFTSTESVVMLPFSALFLGELVGRRMAFLGAVALVGVGISLLPIQGGHGLAGDLLSCCAVLAACAYTVMTQRSMARSSALAVLACRQVAAMPMAILVWWLVPHGSPALPSSSIVIAGVAGLMLLTIPFLLFLGALRQVGSARSVRYLALVPVFAMVLAALGLHERLVWYQYAGAATTVLAIAVLTRQPQPGTANEA